MAYMETLCELDNSTPSGKTNAEGIPSGRMNYEKQRSGQVLSPVECPFMRTSRVIDQLHGM